MLREELKGALCASQNHLNIKENKQNKKRDYLQEATIYKVLERLHWSLRGL